MSESPETTPRRPIRRALLSVWDKTELVELARTLVKQGIEVVSTGSTASMIARAGITVTPVEALTGFPECLDGRVKTLHPRVHAGLLADTRNPEHLARLGELDIAPFDLLVSSLYPFAETVGSGAGPEEIVEMIDIGGPAMVRAAAKNHASVAVVTSPAQYGLVRDALTAGGTTLAERKRLAATAFADIARYDVAVAEWFAQEYAPVDDAPFPAFTGATWERAAMLRYGENPHQSAALYRDRTGGIADAEQLHGKEMSYNNYVDVDAARRAVADFDRPAVAIVKHSNPCGIAVAGDVADAHRRANDCDPVSAYGGVIAANRTVDATMAGQMGNGFTEVIVAPGYDDDALAMLQKKKNLRILLLPDTRRDGVEFREVSGGLLVQTIDRVDAPGDDPASWTLAAGDTADASTLADLSFAWRACRAVKSNAILLAHGGASVGIGMGQVNRVDSCRLAVERAGVERARGAVAASDAFFPFADGPQVLIDAGVTAIVEPGGSIRDEEVVAAAKEAGVTLYFTGTRHFFH